MDRTEALAACLARVGFRDTAEALWRGEPVSARGLLRMLRWAVGYYSDERPAMARALRLGKAWARAVQP